MDTRTIEIDFDVHKLIETERQNFSETPNDVLRRLLGLSPQPIPKKEAQKSERDPGAWTGKGVLLPTGTELRMEYRGREYHGIIRNASWLVEGQAFKSPSAAAGGVTTTKAGGRPSLDGWKYWQVRRPGDAGWTLINSLRPTDDAL